MGLGPSTGAWEYYLWPHSQKLSDSPAPIYVNGSSISGKAWWLPTPCMLGFWLMWFCEGNHSFWEFMNTIAMSCPEDISLFLNILWLFQSFHPLFRDVPRALIGRGVLIWMPHLGLSTQFLILSILLSYVFPYWPSPTVKRSLSDEERSSGLWI